jgi:hypothetical protein
VLGVVAEDADGPAVHPAEAGHHVLRVKRHHLEELALIDDAWIEKGLNVLRPVNIILYIQK